MISFTFTRAEWAAIAEMIAAADPDVIPPGLTERINALLGATPDAWPDEPCVLELEPATAAALSSLTAQHHGVAAAEQIVHHHQLGNPTAPYRIEHRSGGVRSVVAYLTDASSLPQQLATHATRLRAAAATGELVLIEQSSLNEVARQQLLSEPGAEAPPA